MMMIDPRGVLLIAGLTLGWVCMASQDVCMPRHKEYGDVMRPCAELKWLILQGWIQ